MVGQGERLLIKILFMMTCMFVSINIIQGICTQRRNISHTDSTLKVLNKPAVKSIQSTDGDIIDCVEIYKQPALGHPVLKNHTIQMRPNFISKPDIIDDKKNSSRKRILEQIWQRSGSCPRGTIPVRRVKKENLLKFDDIERFGRKNPQFFDDSDKRKSHSNHTLVINNTTVFLGPLVDRSTAIMIATVYHYIGSRGTLNNWMPQVESPDDYTSSQIWLMGGGPEDYQSVEAGWMVNPNVYGDAHTRLFGYWTNDGSKNTGCLDLLCSGFVQTTKELALGAADDKSGNWWLRINDKIDVGYWPGTLFGAYLSPGATLAQWGGEVYSSKIRQSPHIATSMGSGSFAEDLFRIASYISHIRVMEFNLSWTYPRFVGTYADEWNCYSVLHYVPGFMSEPTLFFGGPGKNYRCP